LNIVDFSVNLVPKPTVTYGKGLISNVEMVCSFDFPVWNNVSYLVEWHGKSENPIKKDTWCIPEEAVDDQNDCTRRQSSIFLADHFALGDTVSHYNLKLYKQLYNKIMLISFGLGCISR
jgi:hypothetical protein